MVNTDDDTLSTLAMEVDSPPQRKQKTNESPSPSFSPFENLAHELFVEILQRLPLKLIHLCKCVSKGWYDFISSCPSLVPPFALFYQEINKQVQLTSHEPIFESPGFSLNFLPLPNPSASSSSSSNPHESGPICYLASDNGLVLCSTGSTFQRVYYVCNPLTMHWVELPPPPTCQETVICGFVCNPSFSFDSTTSFRVVRIHQFQKPNYTPPRSANIKLDVFSSDTWEWTEIALSSRGRNFVMSYYISNAVVCNGVLHWLFLYNGRIFLYDPFNNTDEFRIIRHPKRNFKSSCGRGLGECRGQLRYISHYCSIVTIWELKDIAGLEWSLVHNVHLDEIERDHSRLCLQVLALHSVDEDIIYLGLHGRIYIWNVRSRTLKGLHGRVKSAWCGKVFPFVLPWRPTSVPQFQHNPLFLFATILEEVTGGEF